MTYFRPRQYRILGAIVASALLGCGTGEDVTLSESDSTVETQDALRTGSLRIVAANLTSGSDQSYDQGEGIRILKALEPDVVLIQEFNYGSNNDGDIRKMVDQVIPGGKYYREEDKQIPNGIVSRFPILESGAWEDPDMPNREFAWARIDIPGDRDLYAVSVHFSTQNATRRNSQARSVAQYIEDNIPADAYLTVGGDFNSASRSEPLFNTLKSSVSAVSNQAVDQDGRGGTNASRKKPYDWVLVDSRLHSIEVPTVVAGQPFQSGLVFDSRVFSPLEKLQEVRRGDSGAQNMQHMAVVRDFKLPSSK